MTSVPWPRSKQRACIARALLKDVVRLNDVALPTVDLRHLSHNPSA